MLIKVIIEFLLLGVVGGLLGIFYRNCLKSKNMIFNSFYFNVLKPWVNRVQKWEKIGEPPTKWQEFLAWIAYPLGYCIYCSTTWITFFICAIFLSLYEVCYDWQYIVIGIIAASGMQHLVVAISCRFLIYKHPDLE